MEPAMSQQLGSLMSPNNDAPVATLLPSEESHADAPEAVPVGAEMRTNVPPPQALTLPPQGSFVPWFGQWIKKPQNLVIVASVLGVVVPSVLGVAVLLAALAVSHKQPADSKKTATAAQDQVDVDGTYQEKTAGHWAEQLKDKDLATRRAAAKALVAIGPGSKPCSAEIVRALKDELFTCFTLLLQFMAIPEPGQEPFYYFPPKIGYVGGDGPEEARKHRVEQEEFAKKEREAKAKHLEAIEQHKKKVKEYKDKVRPLQEPLRQHYLCLVDLVRALEKADPQQFESLGLAGDGMKQMVEMIEKLPAP
jgi:hypothetical protein